MQASKILNTYPFFMYFYKEYKKAPDTVILV